MAVKEVVEVKESIDKIDSELIELRNKKESLEAKRQQIIKENPKAVLKIDLETISETLGVFYNICRTDYPEFSEAETYLNGLYHNIAFELDTLEEKSSINKVEEPVESLPSIFG